MRNSKNFKIHTKAFTLIEIIIYLALFSIIIGGLMVSGFTLLEYNDTNETNTSIASEAQSVLSKIDFYLSGTKNIVFPHKNSSCQGSACFLQVENFSIPTQRIISYSNNAVFIEEDGDGGRKMGGLPVTHFSVDHQTILDQTHVVSILFTLQATTSLGVVVSQDFQTKYYVRK